MRIVKVAILVLSGWLAGFTVCDELAFRKYGPSAKEQAIADEGCPYCHRQHCIAIVKTWIDGRTSDGDYVCQACGQKLD